MKNVWILFPNVSGNKEVCIPWASIYLEKQSLADAYLRELRFFFFIDSTVLSREVFAKFFQKQSTYGTSFLIDKPRLIESTNDSNITEL